MSWCLQRPFQHLPPALLLNAGFAIFKALSPLLQEDMTGKFHQFGYEVACDYG